MEPTPPPPKDLGQHSILNTKSKSKTKSKFRSKKVKTKSPKSNTNKSSTSNSKTNRNKNRNRNKNSNKTKDINSSKPKRTRHRFRSSKSKTNSKPKSKSKSKHAQSSKSMTIKAKTMDDLDLNLNLTATFSPPCSPPSLVKSPPSLQATRSSNAVTSKSAKKAKQKHTKSRTKMFNIFNSPRSEPPPMPSCQKLQQAASLPVVTNKRSKKRRSLSISRRRKKEPKTGHVRRESKLKSILSNIFPKKTVNKPKKRHSRSISFSLRKNKKKKNKTKNKDITNNESTNGNDSKPKKSRGFRKRKPRKMSENVDINKKRKKGKNKHHKHNSCNVLDIMETMDWMDKLDEDGIDIESDIDYGAYHDDFKSEYEEDNGHGHYRQESPFQSEVRRIKQDMMNNMLEKAVLDEIEEQDETKEEEDSGDSDDSGDNEFSISETEEYKDDLHDINGLPLHRPSLNPKSSSFMRSFEKRPEYTTYYPPASLMEVFNNITVNPEKSTTRSTDTRTKSGSRDRMNAVDQLFELATVNMDYGSYYGHHGSGSSHNSGNGHGLTSHQLFGNHYSAPPELFHEHDTDETYSTYHTLSQYHHDNDNKMIDGNHLAVDGLDNEYDLNPTTPSMDPSGLSSLPEYDEDECEHDMTMAWE